jgi:outer membrane biosynthesis protein TonB
MKKYQNYMNRKNKFKWQYLIIPVYIFLTGCPPPQQVEKKEKPSYNILILLDLSDRLITNEKQAERDKQILNYISNKIPDIIIKNNSVKRSKESIKIIIADQDNIPYPTAQYSDSLFFKMSKDIRGGIPAVRKILKERFPRNLENLYESATFSDNPADYNGANISRYFTQDLSTDIKRDSLSNNLLFILTDGYLNVGENPNFMIDVHNKFPELKVMVLEMTPKSQDYESERLQQSWDQWFANMAVKGYALRNVGPTQAIKEDIDKFFDGSLELTVPGKKNDPITEPEPVTKPVIVSKPEPVSKPVSVSKPEPVSKPVSVSKPEPVSNPVSVSKPEPVSNPVSVSKPVSVSNPVSVSKPDYIITSNSLEEYFKTIANKELDYNRKGTLKKEIIEKYFENENSWVIEKVNNTEVSRLRIKDYVESLSLLNSNFEMLEKKVNDSDKITTLFVKEIWKN